MQRRSSFAIGEGRRRPHQASQGATEAGGPADPSEIAGWRHGGLAIDATVPFVFKEAFERARYEVELVDLAKWFSPEQIARAKASQEGYARWMADRGI